MLPHAKIGNGSKTLVILPGLSVKLVSPLAAAIGAQYQAFLDEEYERFIRIAAPILNYENRDCFDAITAKTLVVGAMGDRVVTAEGTRELAALLSCESYMYDASFGHAVYDEAPDYVGRLLTFCRRA